MNIVGQRFYTRRKFLRISYNEVKAVAANLPAIVDDDLSVAGVFHPARYHGIDGLADNLLTDVSLETVPDVPPHERRRSELIKFLCIHFLEQGEEAGKQDALFIIVLLLRISKITILPPENKL